MTNLDVMINLLSDITNYVHTLMKMERSDHVPRLVDAVL